MSTRTDDAAIASPLSDLRGSAMRSRARFFAMALVLCGVLAIRVRHGRVIRLAQSGEISIARIAASDRLVEIAGWIECFAGLMFVFGLARFLGVAQRTAGALRAPGLASSSSGFAWRALVPGLHLVWPAIAAHRIAVATKTDALPPAVPRVRAEATDGYRDPAGEAVPAPIAIVRPRPALFFVVSLAAVVLARVGDAIVSRSDEASAILLATRFDVAADVAMVLTFLAAARVVRGLESGIREFERRTRFAERDAGAERREEASGA